jgi:hypothetical protein
MDSGDYTLAWSLYALAALVLALCLWRAGRSWRPAALRAALPLSAAVLLLLPARADLAQDALAPALFVALFEYTMSADAAAGQQALLRLGIAVGALALLALAWIGWRRWQRPD